VSAVAKGRGLKQLTESNLQQISLDQQNHPRRIGGIANKRTGGKGTETRKMTANTGVDHNYKSWNVVVQQRPEVHSCYAVGGVEKG